MVIFGLNMFQNIYRHYSPHTSQSMLLQSLDCTMLKLRLLIASLNANSFVRLLC